MQDASALWGNDLAVGPAGDIALVSGTQLGQQRVLRRLLTNAGDYIWQSTYGAGLAQFVGSVTDTSGIRAAIRSQIFKESAVVRTPEPIIDVQPMPDGSLFVQIQYVDAVSQATQLLSFSVGV